VADKDATVWDEVARFEKDGNFLSNGHAAETVATSTAETSLPKLAFADTPAIACFVFFVDDRATGTLYAVAKTNREWSFVQRDALGVTSDDEKLGPVVIRAITPTCSSRQARSLQILIWRLGREEHRRNRATTGSAAPGCRVPRP
jgi:hypothetical protein